MDNRDKSSIYLSIFKRKGDEGLSTKIVNNTNEKDYYGLFSKLEKTEKPLIIYFADMLNWFLLSNSRILMSTEAAFSSLFLSDIKEVTPALLEEMKDGISNKQKFTRLKIKTIKDEYIICRLEQGDSYFGIYQILHFIANNN